MAAKLADAIRAYALANEHHRQTWAIYTQADDIAAYIEATRPESETYSDLGLPRNAAARARGHGATITHDIGGGQWVVRFPDGTGVLAWSTMAERANPHRPSMRAGRLVYAGRTRNAKGDQPPAGGSLEEVLNTYSDAEEARHGRQ